MATNFTPSTVLATIIQDMEADLRLRNARTLDALSAKGSVVSTEMIEMNWNVIASNSSTAGVPMTTAGAASSTPAGTTVKATLPIGASKIYHQFDIYRTDLKDASRRGSQALRQLFRFHINAGVLALRKAVNNAIWLGDGTDAYGGVVGMGTVIGTGTNSSYAGLTAANWISIVDYNATARPLTRTLLNNLDTQRDINESYYDTVVAHPVTLQKYAELFDVLSTTGNITYMQDINGPRDVAPGAKLYNGVPIISDTDCPAGRIVFFDSNSVKMVSMNLADADQGVVSGYGQQDNFSSIAVADIGGLKINVALLPQSNPGVMTFQLFVVPQLKVENRRQVSAVLNLT